MGPDGFLGPRCEGKRWSRRIRGPRGSFSDETEESREEEERLWNGGWWDTRGFYVVSVPGGALSSKWPISGRDYTRPS